MWHELFLTPFLTGLALAVLLPVLGSYLRLRDEWLAALAYSHVAAAGALLALVAGLAPALGGLAAAGLAGSTRRLFSRRLSGGAADALLLSGGWALALFALRRLSRHLLLARIYPDFFRLRGVQAWPIAVGFDLLAALCLALATMILGVMGAFALVFIPPWLAFRRAANWRSGLRLALAIGVLGYLGAFALALALDQPFGPMLTILLVMLGLIVA